MKKLSEVFVLFGIILNFLSLIIPWLEINFFEANNPANVVYSIIITPCLFWTNLLASLLFVSGIITLVLLFLSWINKKEKYAFYSAVLMFAEIVFFIAYLQSVVVTEVKYILTTLSSSLGIDILVDITILLGPIVLLLASIFSALTVILEYL